MSDRFIVAGVFEHVPVAFGAEAIPRVRIGIAGDPADLFSAWRKRYGVFIPVTVFRSGVDDVFAKAHLPVGFNSLPRAAALLYRLPVDSQYRRLVLDSIRQLGELGVSLLSEWFTAAAAFAAAGNTQSE